MGRKSGLDFVEAFCKEGLYVNEIHFHTNDVIGMHKMKQRMNKERKKERLILILLLNMWGAKTPK